jgi:hypothetical protein
MKVEYDYFKEPATREIRRAGLLAYTKAKNTASMKLEPCEAVPGKGHVWVNTFHGLFRIGGGNSKVLFPTINFEAGLTCSSQDLCSYAYANKRASHSKHPLCYAQKLEGSRVNMFNAKIYQAMVCERIARYSIRDDMAEYAKAISSAVSWLKPATRYIRVSEVGDIGPVVAPFAHIVLTQLVADGWKPYLYTKRPADELQALRATGAMVLVSDTDFVCVATEAEAVSLGIPLCPGECGGPVHKCYRCPLGKTTAVVAH